MNGLSGAKQNILIDPGMITMIPGLYERDIALSFQFRSDSIRVLNALSIPEYVEVWLQTPDTGEQQFVFNQVTQKTFQIDLYRAEGIRQAFTPLAGSSARIKSATPGRQHLTLAPPIPSST